MHNRRPPAARRPPAPAALALVALVALLVAAAPAPAPAQEAPPALTIDEPGADAYLVDRVQLRATVTGVVDVAAVAFFVDGAPACEAPAPGFTCAWDAGPRVRARVVRAVARLPDGGRLVHSVRTRDRPATFFTAETSVVLVPVVVRDRRGRFVDGLTQDDFAIFENGVPQEIRFFETRGVPLDLVLAVDFSSSVAPVAGALRRAARRFVGALAGSGSLSVIAFNDRPFVLARRERDADKLLAAIDRLPRPIGGTAMLDAISRALTLHGEDLAHQVVVLFTDGDDQHSLSSLQGVEERIRTSQATVYVVTLGEGRRIERVRTLLERLTSVSGGRSFPIERIADVERALDAVRSDLRERYFLGYRPSNADLDGTWRQIEVRTPDRRHVIRAREGYLASPSLGGAAGARPYRQPPPGRARPLPAAAEEPVDGAVLDGDRSRRSARPSRRPPAAGELDGMRGCPARGEFDREGPRAAVWRGSAALEAGRGAGVSEAAVDLVDAETDDRSGGLGRRRGVEAADSGGAGRVRLRAADGDHDVVAVAEVDVGPAQTGDLACVGVTPWNSRATVAPSPCRGARRSSGASSPRPARAEVGGETRVVERPVVEAKRGAGGGPWRRCGGCWATSCA